MELCAEADGKAAWRYEIRWMLFVDVIKLAAGGANHSVGDGFPVPHSRSLILTE